AGPARRAPRDGQPRGNRRGRGRRRGPRRDVAVRAALRERCFPRCARLRVAAARAGARRERRFSLRGGDAGGARFGRRACVRRRRQLQVAAGMSGELEKRASDAEREQVVVRLRDASAEGRLTLEELADRTALAYTARSHAELGPLTDDLPAALAPSRRTPG